MKWCAGVTCTHYRLTHKYTLIGIQVECHPHLGPKFLKTYEFVCTHISSSCTPAPEPKQAARRQLKAVAVKRKHWINWLWNTDISISIICAINSSEMKLLPLRTCGVRFNRNANALLLSRFIPLPLNGCKITAYLLRASWRVRHSKLLHSSSACVFRSLINTIFCTQHIYISSITKDINVNW